MLNKGCSARQLSCTSLLLYKALGLSEGINTYVLS